jgi:hypothetical protein
VPPTSIQETGPHVKARCDRREAEPMGDDVLGPIDYLAVEFPGGHVTSDAFQSVMDLTRRGIIRVLDLEFVAKSGDGAVRKVALDSLTDAIGVDVTLWQGAESGLLDRSDFDTVASGIAPGSIAGILVYEHVWAAPLIATIERSGAHVVGDGRIAVDDLLTALDSAEGA